MEKKNRRRVYHLVTCALMAAVLCVTAPLTVPVGPIPVTLATLVVCLAGVLLGPRYGVLSVLVYLLLGLAGLPVFSGYLGGVARLVGPTGGYIVGFLPLALLTGLLAERFGGKPLPTALGMVLGTVALYVLGTAWFLVQAGCTLSYALSVCVVPFLLTDLCKIAVSTALGSVLRLRLHKAGLLD